MSSRLPAVPALAAAAVAFLMLGAGLVAPAVPSHEDPAAQDARAVAVASGGPSGTPDIPAPPAPAGGARPFASFWEENLGQWPGEALWVLRGNQVAGLTPDGLVLASADGPIRITFVGGSPAASAAPVVVSPLPSTTSVVGGGLDVVGAAHAARLRLPQVWPGIDFEVYPSAAGNLEFDFVVAPGADPATARLRVDGVRPALQDGRLVLGEQVFQAPVSFQGEARVDSWFVLDGQTFGVAVGPYDPALPLTIDPELTYGTLVATPPNAVFDMVVGSKATDENIYFGGTMDILNGWTHPDASQDPTTGPQGSTSAYFVRLGKDHVLQHFVELRPVSSGGTAYVFDIDVDSQGRVFLAGTTSSWGIPTVGGYAPVSTSYDPFLARFAPQGGGYVLDFSTHLNSMGGWWAWGIGVVVNPDDSFWLAGRVEGSAVRSGAVMDIEPGSGTGFYSDNVFGALWSGGPNPDHLLTKIVGGQEQDYVSRFAGDEDGALYFVGTARTNTGLPTTPDALHPSPLGGTYDHFYGKIGRDGKLEHLSYWGTPFTEPLTFSGSLLQSQRPGPAIAVIGPDEILIAGTAPGCCVDLTPHRIGPGGFGGYDGYVSHIHMATGELVFSSHVGGTNTDYASAVAYDPSSGTYFVGGDTRGPLEPILPAQPDMPKPGHNGGIDLFVSAIAPSAINDADPSNSEGMVTWHMYVGPQHGLCCSTSYLRDLSYAPGSLFASGTQWSNAPGNQAPVTADALNGQQVANNNYDGFFQHYQLASFLKVTATQAPQVVHSPGTLSTLTLTEVEVTAAIDPAVDWTTPQDLRWDLDGDGAFGDGAGPGPLTVARGHQELVKVCARLPNVLPSMLPIVSCVGIFFENRPPVIDLVLGDEPLGFDDPLPIFHRNQPVLFDAGLSYDPEGALVHAATQWTVERPGPTGWEPDVDAGLGGTASLGAVGWFPTAGQKRVSLTIVDEFGATAAASLSIMVANAPPQVACGLDGATRAGRWLDIDVSDVTDPDGSIAAWVLDPGMGLQPVTGSGMPPLRIRSPEPLPMQGAGTAVLTVVDNEGGTATCAMDYIAGAQQVQADFTWTGPLTAATSSEFFDASVPEVPERPIVGWEWRVDGRIVPGGPDLVHTFPREGTYRVSLRVTDGTLTDTYAVPVHIGPAPAAPVARIGLEEGPYYSDRPVVFRDASVAGASAILTRSWELDGISVTGGDTMSRHFPPGTHVIRLTVIDEMGLDSVHEVAIVVLAETEIVPEFIVSDLAPGVGHLVTFTDVTRTGGRTIVDRQWTLADGSPVQHGTSITHRFWHEGSYNVTLTLVEPDGSRHHAAHTVSVADPAADPTRLPPHPASLPIADAGVDRRVLAGSVVLLDGAGIRSGQSTGVSATWRHVSGPSVELVPQGHGVSLLVPYATGEVVVLELVVADANGVSLPDRVRLEIVEQHADPLGLVPTATASWTLDGHDRWLRFTAPEHTIPATFHWDFGDGSTGTGPQAVHEYGAFGTYQVTLTVTDVHGRETHRSETVTVRAGAEPATQRLDSAEARILGVPLQQAMAATVALALLMAGAAVWVQQGRARRR